MQIIIHLASRHSSTNSQNRTGTKMKMFYLSLLVTYNNYEVGHFCLTGLRGEVAT